MILENIKFNDVFTQPNFDKVRNILNLINNNKIDYRLISDFTLERKEVYDIFNTRYEIQKFVTKKDIFKGYDELLSNISNLSDDVILKILALRTDNIFIQIFIRNENREVLGILWRVYEPDVEG